MSWSETYNSGSNPIIVSGGGGGALTGLWSQAATWGGAVPLATDVVTIAAGHTVYLDTTSAVALSLDIQGSLIAVQTASVGLTTGNINVGAAGVLQIGTEATPYPAAYTATITLNGAEVGRATRTVLSTSMGFTNNGVGRSLQVQAGGTLSLIGVAPTYKRTKLNASAAAGTNTFTLMDSVDWLAGDDIVMGTTDFYGVSTPEKLTLQTNASGTTIQTTSTIASPRWGALQYVTDSGMSLTAGTLTSPPAGTPTTLDERAFVVNLTRNIVVQGANDTAWISNKFGAHMMFMSGGSTPGTFTPSNIKIDGVRFNRMGQAGAIGRYPLHWHMMSYNMSSGVNVASPDGVFIGAVTGHYAKNCAFDSSGQRMITIHGTRGVTLDSNVGFDITGHAIFLEDGSEMSNTITNNVVMKVRAPTSANRLITNDAAASVITYLPDNNTPNGTAGVWFTNPNNVLTGNWINDSEGAGIWNSFAATCFGLSVNVAISPTNTGLGTWDGNVAMGNNGTGALTNFEVINDKGDLSSTAYVSSFLTNPLTNFQSFKNNSGGYNNRIREGKYQGWTGADNAGMDVFGQAQSALSVSVNMLTIAESLNNANSKRLSSKRAAWATYHELLNFQNAIAVGYAYIVDAQYANDSSPIGGGLFRMWDLYLAPFFSFYANTGIKQINGAPPARTKSPQQDGYPLQVGVTAQYRNWALAGAIHDQNGLFVPAGSYWTYDDAFFTTGATSPTQVAPSGSNGVYTTDHYFGVNNFNHSEQPNTNTTLPVTVSRQNTSGTQVGIWQIGDGAVSPFFNSQKHFAAHNGGRFRLSFPSHVATSFVDFIISNMLGSGRMFLLGVEFSGSAAKVYMKASYLSRDTGGKCIAPTAGEISSGYGRVLTSTGSLANVVADTTGTLFFQETGTNTVWFQVNPNSMLTAYPWTYESVEALNYKNVHVSVQT